MDRGTQSDQELVAATLRDKHAYVGLVERYEAPLLRYVRRLGADRELAKDAVQEAFIKAYVNLNDYDPSLAFSAWLYRIVHNETISLFRKMANRPAPVTKEEDLGLFERIPDELDLVVESDRARVRAAVARALSRLEPKYREVMVLRFFEEMSYDEISDILRIPHGTVATLINRGKSRLREFLQNDKTIYD